MKKILKWLFETLNMKLDIPVCKHDWVLTGDGRFDYTCSKCGKLE